MSEQSNIRYSMAREVAKYLYYLGFFIIVFGILAGIIVAYRGGFSLMALYIFLGSILIGIFTMANAEIVAAVLDTADSTKRTADNTKKMLEEIRAGIIR